MNPISAFPMLAGLRRQTRQLLCLVAMSAALAACGGGGGGGVTATPTTIKVAPSSTAVADGDSAVLAVSAGPDPLTYQWMRDGVPIDGATQPVYVTPALVPAESGAKYAVVVSGADGSVTTVPATVTVRAVAPSIEAQPQAQTVSLGQRATFSVLAHGSKPLSYQWQRNGVDIAGANGASFTTAETTASDAGARFRVIVRGPGGEVVSADPTLSVSQAGPAVGGFPQLVVAAQGQRVVLSGTLTGAPPFTYQWWRNGQVIDGAGGTTSDTTITFRTAALTAADNGAGLALTINSADGFTRSPTVVIAVLVAPSVAAGGSHSLARSSDGSKVWAWGSNLHGQLGLGSTSASATPVVINGLSGVKAIAAGADHSLALKDDGTVWAWGRNAVGALGDGTQVDRRVPQRVAGLSDVIAIAAAAGRSFALRSDGQLWAWGENATGALGNGSQSNAGVPTLVGQGVAGFADIVAVAAGARHTVALRADGRVFVAGEVATGPVLQTSPVLVDGLTKIAGIAAGDGFSTAVDISAKLWAWGKNDSGRLGQGDMDARAMPVAVARMQDGSTVLPILGLSAGSDFALARSVDGSVVAWGAGSHGQLGGAEPATGAMAPRVIGALPVPMVFVASGTSHSLAVRSDGAVYAWGANAGGQLGIGSTEARRALPVQIPGLDLD
jgi:alpha-tubulin suppressor-like RCC1 family protein